MEFCTVFDKSYLPKALTLYRSIEKTGIKTHALCLDIEAYHKVKSLAIGNFIPYYLLDIENDDPGLITLKKKETKSMFGDQYSRYVWALTPYFCNYILNKTDSEELIYIDSDIYFYSGIGEITKEVEGYSVGIVTHRTLHHINNETDSGKYNVGIVYFRKDQYGLDYLSLDIEGMELKALKGFPFDDYEILAITVEHNLYTGKEDYKREIKNFLEDKGYLIYRENIESQGSPFEDWYINRMIKEKL